MSNRSIVTLFSMLLAPAVLAGDIAGFWKHAEEPGWIEISIEDGLGKGVVVRNDVYPERVGRELLKDLRSDEKNEGVWRGRVYAEKLGEYKDAEISLPESGQMEIKVKVGFMSRTLDWIRVDGAPD